MGSKRSTILWFASALVLTLAVFAVNRGFSWGKVCFLQATAESTASAFPAWINYTSPVSIFPESVVFDAKRHRFLVSSFRAGPKVFAVDPREAKPAAAVFIAEGASAPAGADAAAGGEGELGAVDEKTGSASSPGGDSSNEVQFAGATSALGLFIDETRDRLLVVFNNLVNPSDGNLGALGAYSLSSGDRQFLVRLDQLPAGVPFALANDVAVDDASGDAYVTDSIGNRIWRVTAGGEPSLFLQNPVPSRLKVLVTMPDGNPLGLNGAVVPPGGGFLLVGHSASGEILKVVMPSTDGEAPEVTVVDFGGAEPLIWADGLRFRSDGKLIVTSRFGVRLVESRDGWKSAKILDFVEQSVEMSSTTVAFMQGHPYLSFAFFPELFGGIDRNVFLLKRVDFPSEGKSDLHLFVSKNLEVLSKADPGILAGAALLLVVILFVLVGPSKKPRAEKVD